MATTNVTTTSLAVAPKGERCQQNSSAHSEHKDVYHTNSRHMPPGRIELPTFRLLSNWLLMFYETDALPTEPKGLQTAVRKEMPPGRIELPTFRLLSSSVLMFYETDALPTEPKGLGCGTSTRP